MNPWSALTILLLLIAGNSYGQWGGAKERAALRDMEKERWKRAEARLRKAIAKDSLDPSVHYTLSVFYFRGENPAYDLDSAYRYALEALAAYTRMDARSRERLHRSGVDSLRMVNHRARIDSTAFDEARRLHTEEAYQEFLSHFPTSERRALATSLRDEVAYQDALARNTHEAFHRFLERYPEAERVADASRRYHQLLYDDKTRDERVESYVNFLRSYPDSPYRPKAYEEVFSRLSADGRSESFLDYWAQYPDSPPAKRAAAIAFHKMLEDGAPEWPEGFLNDSLRYVLSVADRYLAPILSGGRYGFIDSTGEEILSPQYVSMDENYFCGLVEDDVLWVDHKLVSRTGGLVCSGPVRAWSDLGTGYLLVTDDDQQFVVHKSGHVVADDVEDARVVARHFLALRRRGAWQLYSLAGRLLDERTWDDVKVVQELVVLISGDKRYMAPVASLVASPDKLGLSLSAPFDELRPWLKGLLWGRSGEYQGVVDHAMNTVIRFDRHELSETFFGARARVPNGFVLYNHAGKRSSTLDASIVAGRQVAGKRNGAWHVLDVASLEAQGRAYDSMRAEGPFLVGYTADSTAVHFVSGRILRLNRTATVAFVPGGDTTSFLTTAENSRERTVYDLHGSRLFTQAFDAIAYAGQGAFAVTVRGRKGLTDLRGNALLPPRFDAIGSARDSVISLLADRRFGAYHLASGRYIKPQYDRNLTSYAASWLLASRDGALGFIRWDGTPASAFAFDEVQYWNDSVALVRHNGEWAFYDLAGGQTRAAGFRSVSLISDDTAGRAAIVQRGKTYGVVNRHGREVIPATFNDIVNLGSAQRPLYFTEKHIREASLFVVIYYDAQGEMLRKEIYDDAAEYDKIYCTVN